MPMYILSHMLLACCFLFFLINHSSKMSTQPSSYLFPLHMNLHAKIYTYPFPLYGYSLIIIVVNVALCPHRRCFCRRDDAAFGNCCSIFRPAHPHTPFLCVRRPLFSQHEKTRKIQKKKMTMMMMAKEKEEARAKIGKTYRGNDWKKSSEHNAKIINEWEKRNSFALYWFYTCEILAVHIISNGCCRLHLPHYGRFVLLKA